METFEISSAVAEIKVIVLPFAFSTADTPAVPCIDEVGIILVIRQSGYVDGGCGGGGGCGRTVEAHFGPYGVRSPGLTAGITGNGRSVKGGADAQETAALAVNSCAKAALVGSSDAINCAAVLTIGIGGAGALTVRALVNAVACITGQFGVEGHS